MAKGIFTKLDIRYRDRDLVVFGTWFDEDKSYLIRQVFMECDASRTGDFWPVIEDSDVGEELTGACEKVLIEQARLRDEELRASGGMGVDYQEVAA